MSTHRVKHLTFLRQVSRSKEKKRQMREILLKQIQDYPVRNENTVRHISQKDLSTNPFFFTHLFSQKRSMPAFAILLSLIIGTGTVAAAQTSVPGDVLYPVKIYVNESVKGAFQVGVQADTRWELEQIDARLEETATLRSRGELTQEHQAQIEEQIDTHIQAIESRSEDLEVKGETQAAKEIEGSLDAYLDANAQVFDELGLEINVEGEMDGSFQEEESTQGRMMNPDLIEGNVETDIDASMETEIEATIEL